MATTTENLELTLLSGTDNFDTDTIMENFTKIDTAVGEADSSIGEKDSLTTTAKDNLVAAINEVDGNIGDLSGLTTTAKTNLVSALNEVNQNMKKIYVKYATVQYDSERSAYTIHDDSGITWDSAPMVVAVNVATDRPRIVITATYYNNSEIFFTAMMDNELYTQDILAYIALIGD